jgi:hypothetical protein
VSGKTPRLCQWVFFENNFDGITIFEDGYIWQIDVDKVESKYKVGWLHEERELRNENYLAAWELRHKFDFILTHDARLLEADPDKFKECIRGGVTIPRDEWKLDRPKSKDIAMILSEKNQTIGQLLRHKIYSKYIGTHQIDFFGLTDGKVDKAKVLAPYRFVITNEAALAECYFTEHILDVIAMDCIPIYCGPSCISRYLNADGLIKFNSLGQLGNILYKIILNGQQIYDMHYLERRENIKTIEQYEVTEDWFTEKHLLPLLSQGG